VVLLASADQQAQQARLLVYVRVAVLVLATGVLAATPVREGATVSLLALAGIAVLASVPLRRSVVERLQPVAEAAAAAAVTVAVEPLPEPLLVYLLAPGLAAGLRYGFIQAVNAAGVATLVALLFEALLGPLGPVRDRIPTLAQWILLMLAVGLLGAWIGRLQLQSAARPENESYAAAYRLISQLRQVARQLSSGLDTVTLATRLLEDVRRELPYARAGLFVRSRGTDLAPLAFEGTTGFDPDGADFATAYDSGRPLVLADAVVLPLRSGTRAFGAIVAEDNATVEADGLERAMRLVDEMAPRLDTALLFDEVRSIATAEERRRVAREIHDGIAQELASLGYVVDDLAATSTSEPDREALRGLRRELSRIVSELRLSIFDLAVRCAPGTAWAPRSRSSYAPQGPVPAHGAPVAGRGAPSPTGRDRGRAPADRPGGGHQRTQALRAANLWVTCFVDPPRAVVRVEDDGSGLGDKRADSFGLEIMRERAARIGATLVVRNRSQGGTSVEVALGE
jgi:signal transduction histidine kinase